MIFIHSISHLCIYVAKFCFCYRSRNDLDLQRCASSSVQYNHRKKLFCYKIDNRKIYGVISGYQQLITMANLPLSEDSCSSGMNPSEKFMVGSLCL